ncbi:MAG: glycosyltransferase family 2 protein [Lachnospiraceae bacterium]|nr:glycosyltransferase family 2 protein [Lachnospiraceae bacterium]
MQEKLVSIIVPVYNAGAYIEETIRMVEKQTYQEWELILVDDCSSDNSKAVIEEYLQKRNSLEEGMRRQEIRLLVKQQNEGAAMARNTGMEAAKGRYIAFLDADDIWLSKKLSKEMTFMEKQQASFVFSAYEFGDENAKGTGKIVHVPEKLTYRRALSRTVIFTTTVLLDRKKIPAELLSMPNVKSEDTAFWWKLLKNGIVACGLDEVLAIYRRPAKSLSSNKWEAIKRIWNLYRRQEQLPVIAAAYYFVFWAMRATLRRL